MAHDLDDDELRATRILNGVAWKEEVTEINVGDLEKHIHNLKEYCRIDRTNIEYEGDFGEFCKGHIEDIEAVLSALNNSVSKDEIKEVIKENERVKSLAKEQLTEEVIIADSDSLNCGRIEGHNFAIHKLQELLNKGE